MHAEKGCVRVFEQLCKTCHKQSRMTSFRKKYSLEAILQELNSEPKNKKPPRKTCPKQSRMANFRKRYRMEAILQELNTEPVNKKKPPNVTASEPEVAAAVGGASESEEAPAPKQKVKQDRKTKVKQDPKTKVKQDPKTKETQDITPDAPQGTSPRPMQFPVLTLRRRKPKRVKRVKRAKTAKPKVSKLRRAMRYVKRANMKVYRFEKKKVKFGVKVVTKTSSLTARGVYSVVSKVCGGCMKSVQKRMSYRYWFPEKPQCTCHPDVE